MLAFIPTSSFTPTSLNSNSFTAAPLPADVSTTKLTSATPFHHVIASTYSLDKYAAMSTPDQPPTLTPSKPSSFWTQYLNSVKQQRFNPFERPKPQPSTKASSLLVNTPAYYQVVTNAANRAKNLGGDPEQLCVQFTSVDKYIARCVTTQYKMTAAPNGVYSVRCMEGAARGQAEQARNAALSMEFRRKQRSCGAKFADYTETRRKAMIAAKGCSYEEGLVARYPAAARAFVLGGSEARSTCVRYAVGESVEEKYMVDSVDKQLKFKAVPRGVYDVVCNDGNARNMAEYKRVSALAAKYRAKQMSPLAREQLKFDAAKYAREFFAHGCDYEETLFNRYAAVGMAMRPNTARY